MLVIIVCCISFFFLSKKEEDKKRLWKKIGVIGFCFGSVLHFVADLTVGWIWSRAEWGAASNVFTPLHGYALMYLTGAGVFLAVFTLVYFVPQKMRPVILWGMAFLFGGLFMIDAYMINYGLAAGKSSCYERAIRPTYAYLLWCPTDRPKPW